MAVDFRWMSFGGLLLDGSGDIAVTAPRSGEDIRSIVQSRLKSAVTGWKLYNFGADLESVVGESAQQELDVALQRSAVISLTSDGFLSPAALDVVALLSGVRITVLVYLQNQLIAQANLASQASL